MSDRKRIDSVKRGAGSIARAHGKIPDWVIPPFRPFFGFAQKWAKEFNKHLLNDREEEMIKKANKSFENM